MAEFQYKPGVDYSVYTNQGKDGDVDETIFTLNHTVLEDLMPTAGHIGITSVIKGQIPRLLKGSFSIIGIRGSDGSDFQIKAIEVSDMYGPLKGR